MGNIRLIARLDVKAPYLVKGIQFEGLRKLGDPNEFAIRYYQQGIDELYFEDIVASLYERNTLLDIIKNATRDIYVPVTVGGGLRSIQDVAAVLRSGADKVAINTAAIKNPTLISEVATRFGTQCMVLSIQAKRQADSWEAYYDNGREHSGLDVMEWAAQGQSLGAGEILITSVDQEGTGKGFDVDLIKQLEGHVNVPVIASGGMGCSQDMIDVIQVGNADAVAMAHVLHYGYCSVSELRSECKKYGLPVRYVETESDRGSM